MSFDLDTALVFDRVTRRFGGNQSAALDAVRLEIMAGGMTCLVGPNGAGKSTALALAAGLLPATSGAILFAGHEVSPSQPPQRFGYLPQHSAFPLSLRVAEVLDFAVAARTTTTGARDEVIHLGDLSAVLDRAIGTLSTGWLRRLGLAVALLDPIDLLLLDEPFVGLDLATLERTLELLVARSSSGTTILLSSHDFEIVDRLAPEIAVLDDGKLLAVESREKDQPGSSRAFYQRALAGGLDAAPSTADSRVKEPPSDVAAI